tara:strand:- start:62 stop:907 length:846 start_codon:yes stop_codon:yes gene_type:complete
MKYQRYIQLLLIAIILVCLFNIKIETFENDEYYNKNLDNVDKVYAKLYNIVFNEKFIYDYDVSKITPTLKKNSNILDAGTGTGKYYEYFFKNHKIVGVDMSKDMLKYAKIRCPIGNFIVGNLKNSELFQPKEFTHVLCLLDTLYHNDYQDQAKILKNFYDWLQPGGYLFVHIFDYNKLIPTPRNYSTMYVDDSKNLHSYTEFQNFNHDAFYVKNDNNVIYKEKFTMNKTGKTRFQATKLYIPLDKKRTVKQILEVGFKTVNIYKMDFYEDTDIELFVFKKT